MAPTPDPNGHGNERAEEVFLEDGPVAEVRLRDPELQAEDARRLDRHLDDDLLDRVDDERRRRRERDLDHPRHARHGYGAPRGIARSRPSSSVSSSGRSAVFASQIRQKSSGLAR